MYARVHVSEQNRTGFTLAAGEAFTCVPVQYRALQMTCHYGAYTSVAHVSVGQAVVQHMI